MPFLAEEQHPTLGLSAGLLPWLPLIRITLPVPALVL